MSRIEIDQPAVRSTGGRLQTIPHATVLILKRSDESHATVYAASSGGATLSNPLTADDAGRIEGWLESGSYDFVIDDNTGAPTYTQRCEAVYADGIAALIADYASDEEVAAALAALVAQKGQSNGIASLDSGGKVPTGQLPPQSPGGGPFSMGFFDIGTSQTTYEGAEPTIEPTFDDVNFFSYYRVSFSGDDVPDGKSILLLATPIGVEVSHQHVGFSPSVTPVDGTNLAVKLFMAYYNDGGGTWAYTNAISWSYVAYLVSGNPT
jgi:hypothetical protein